MQQQQQLNNPCGMRRCRVTLGPPARSRSVSVRRIHHPEIGKEYRRRRLQQYGRSFSFFSSFFFRFGPMFCVSETGRADLSKGRPSCCCFFSFFLLEGNVHVSLFFVLCARCYRPPCDLGRLMDESSRNLLVSQCFRVFLYADADERR